MRLRLVLPLVVSAVSCASKSAPLATSERFACQCGLHASTDEPTSSARCSLRVGEDGFATLTGQAATPSGNVRIQGGFTVVPVPPGRVEPEAFVAFRGALDLTCSDAWCGKREVEAIFVDNLMFEIPLGAEPSLAIALVCNPPRY